MRRERILIVDGGGDGPELAASLRACGAEPVCEASLERAFALLPGLSPSAVVVDATAPDSDGAALVRRVRELGSDAAVVVTVPEGRIAAAVEAMRAGADAFVAAPLAPAQVRFVVERALEARRLRRDRAALRRSACDRAAVVGAHPAIAAAAEVVARVGPTRATVLLVGEQGTGKHHLAQALHEASPRADAPFVRVTCAGVSEALLEAELFGHELGAFGDDDHRRAGAFEEASGGTVYLHEVGRLPPGLQVKLLRILQHGELERVGGSDPVRVDVRVIASTRLELAEEVRRGRFRDDLYYRLRVIEVPLPPLRARRNDVPALVAHFAGRHAAAAGRHVDGISPGALSALLAYDWPGNVAELEHVVAHAVARCRGRELQADDLTPVLKARAHDGVASALIPGATLFEIERDAILRTLDGVGGSTTRAAAILGISVRKIQYRLKEYRDGATAAVRRVS
ncbi:MAG TPA: sigma-54 dependent transcriptional regulator [Anaeromyxobacteraceae bacterium]|nr:sigma-54 dependent transcriptional regulator [Anaeromyxobacteraceae bacterium]